jgi:hypothetical protein
MALLCGIRRIVFEDLQLASPPFFRYQNQTARGHPTLNTHDPQGSYEADEKPLMLC